MSKWQKILIIVFCAGMLLCGLGGGIFFTEFSALSYGGQQFLGEPDMRTENFDVKYDSGEVPKEIIGAYAWGNGGVQTDYSVPQNTVRFRVTYNADVVTPYAYWDQDTDCIMFSSYWHNTYDDMAYMMEAKDVFLENLKEGKLVSFDVPNLEEVTVLVNPQSLDDIRDSGVIRIR